jgi:drug/metabolite transporter (DMT)-like permease
MGAAVQMLSASIASAVFGLITGEGPRWSLPSISGQSWLALGYLIAAGSLVAYPVYLWLLRHSTPARVSTYAYVNPVIAVVLGWAVLGEPLTARMALAAAIIVGAVAIITIERNRA